MLLDQYLKEGDLQCELGVGCMGARYRWVHSEALTAT